MYDVPYMQSNIISGSSGSNVGLFSFVCLCLRGDFDFDFDMKLKTDRVL